MSAPTQASSPPEEYDKAFMRHLRAEADTTFGEPPDVGAVRIAYHKLVDDCASGTEGVTQADLYALDRLLLNMSSADELWAEAPGMYRRYCEERGESVDPNDLTMTQGDPTKVKALRARLLQILRGLHWSYTFGPIREAIRVSLITRALFAMCIATLAVGAVIGTLYVFDKRFFAVLSAVVYAGVMGGLASCTLRLSEIPSKGDALGSIHALKNSRYVLFFSPITGAIFAVVAMGLFMGGVLKGAVFPEFVQLPSTEPLVFPMTVKTLSYWAFTELLVPTNSAQYALLFVWCFIAGFAERFVPDTLSDLIRRGRTSEQSKASRPASPPSGSGEGSSPRTVH